MLFEADPSILNRRIQGEQKAEEALKIARKQANFIAKFPYVQSVCVSGSLSKNYFDKKSDIDFFIITTPNRLWICRSLLVAWKKIFLMNSFSNYFTILQ